MYVIVIVEREKELVSWERVVRKAGIRIEE